MTRIPDMIGYAGVNFSPNDPYLDDLLNRGLKEFPTIGSRMDLRSLTQWARFRIRYDDRAADAPETVSVGQTIEQYGGGGVCRHIAAVEFAMLELAGITPTPVSVRVYNPAQEAALIKQGKELSQRDRHVYLEVPDFATPETVCLDPTSGICGTPATFTALNKHKGYEFEDRRTHKLRGYWIWE